ncbi:tRNA (adenosine(37)-N6)-dimethylallyltransferase MiaA [Xylella fastidiosa]|uniref:tRNA dimethylallyltransferase n=1 Tax=Xylella fastidiosa subsp. sandyi Ann-1 TaxID=155920 RepID=A0A060H153_XYLFS|nr:tRNA (adenosine(37)-N6)-dimethylallyltransferase MiaA [Xylella fastidiosa]AIC09253.1 tRNA delta(2)-isopentenylpyrophosphate transferase [Xylella fastidiosa subsp. sandyi Ann-1]UIX81389.1 tRNA (adenosine(37)-N6)-dimethylallyltransferase MiaA [Xylella fastidiosa subsp. sandyi]
MPADTRPAAIVLMGPTASGKSQLAIDIAKRWGGEVISVDSVLVYRGLDIGTAKPNAAMRASVPHHLIDICEPWETYSAANFAHDARAAIDMIVRRGALPILTGGTGLYFRALLAGLSDMPPAHPEIRAMIAAEAKRDSWATLHTRLAEVDAITAARIHATDPQRIQRALEVYLVSGRSMSDWQNQPPKQRLPLRVLKLVLAPTHRKVLHFRIAQRFKAMLDNGLLAEVNALRTHPSIHAMARPLDLPAMRAVGYRQCWEHLDGMYTAEMLYQRSVAATRQLAKRQLTWLRGELDALWFDPEHDQSRIEKVMEAFLNR